MHYNYMQTLAYKFTELITAQQEVVDDIQKVILLTTISYLDLCYLPACMCLAAIMRACTTTLYIIVNQLQCHHMYSQC